MAKQKKPTMDQELIRINGMHNVIEDLADRLFSLKRQLGDSAYERARQYLSARHGWFLGRFINK